MKREEAIETPAKTILKMGKSALTALAILVGILGLAFTLFLHTHSVPDANTDLASVARDTTFYAGAAQSQRGEGSTISVRAVGQVDDSTAYLLVTYANDSLVAIKGPLRKGQIDQLWVSDFYDRRAKITFLHNSVQHGHLHLHVHFSYPPASWEYKQTNRGWVKAN